MTAYERTNWRDEQISNRHRLYGEDVPCVDIDFAIVEYDNGITRALIDYKHHEAVLGNLATGSYRALGGLHDKDGNQVPFFIVRYWPGAWTYSAKAMNRAARTEIGADWLDMTEEAYVEWLYHLRGREAPQEVLDALETGVEPVSVERDRIDVSTLSGGPAYMPGRRTVSIHEKAMRADWESL